MLHISGLKSPEEGGGGGLSSGKNSIVPFRIISYSLPFIHASTYSSSSISANFLINSCRVGTTWRVNGTLFRGDFSLDLLGERWGDDLLGEGLGENLLGEGLGKDLLGEENSWLGC